MRTWNPPGLESPCLGCGVALGIVLGLWLGMAAVGAGPRAEFWLTHPDGAARFEPQAGVGRFEPLPPGAGGAAAGRGEVLVIEVDDARADQEVDGFGCTLTGGSAQLLMAMGAPARDRLLEELFGTGERGIGLSYLRVSVAASDLNTRVFSYDDVPAGETDPGLARFSLGPDREDVIPVLRRILGIQPRLKIMASPWSAPAWMKEPADTRGGRLKREWFGTYARYLVKYVEAMRAEGIAIDALTVQNEPLNPENNPSMFMPAVEQAEFIGKHLGPAFRAAGLRTRIICYDHNADRPDYPLAVLDDPVAKAFVDGSAFHLYAGNIGALARVREAHPDRNLYFTEQWMGAPGNLRGDLAWHVTYVLVGALRQGCRTVLEWNLAADPRQDPHTDRGGCERCLGAVTLDGDAVTRNPAYYVLAHASKFVRPGSVRVASTPLDSLPNVAFRTPGGSRVLVVLNPGREPRAFETRHNGLRLPGSLPGGAVGTYVWQGQDRVPAPGPGNR